jgi:hypothetical protein
LLARWLVMCQKMHEKEGGKWMYDIILNISIEGLRKELGME